LLSKEREDHQRGIPRSPENVPGLSVQRGRRFSSIRCLSHGASKNKHPRADRKKDRLVERSSGCIQGRSPSSAQNLVRRRGQI
jgi:hypothetical protein